MSLSSTQPPQNQPPQKQSTRGPDIALSYELFPPRNASARGPLWKTIRAIEQTHPDYVSVTFGTGGDNRTEALELLKELLDTTTLKPLAHLTCLGNTVEEITAMVTEMLGLGVRGILALRGDKDKALPHAAKSSLNYAEDLIRLVRTVERHNTARLGAGRLAIGVAAYANRHPESPTELQDVEVLLAKEAAGADFALTQVFFDPRAYENLLSRARRAGVTIPIIPGIMPLTVPRRIARISEMAGIEIPAPLLDKLSTSDDAARRKAGIQATTDLARAALDAGAPGLHLYTFNQYQDSLDVLDNLNLSRLTRVTAPQLRAV